MKLIKNYKKDKEKWKWLRNKWNKIELIKHNIWKIDQYKDLKEKNFNLEQKLRNVLIFYHHHQDEVDLKNEPENDFSMIKFI